MTSAVGFVLSTRGEAVAVHAAKTATRHGWEAKVERDETQGGVHLTERMYGRFYRAIPLPEGAKVDEAKAKFEKGVLEITVPLEEPRNQTREIPIEASSPATSPQTASTKAA